MIAIKVFLSLLVLKLIAKLLVSQPGTLLDPLNVLGLRQRTIDRLIEQGGQDLINSYDSRLVSGSLSTWNRALDGITDDDITKGILRRNERMRQSDQTSEKILLN